MFMSYELHLHNLFGFLNADMIYEWSLGSPDVDEQVPEEGDLDVEVRDHLKYCLKFPLGGLCHAIEDCKHPSTDLVPVVQLSI